MNNTAALLLIGTTIPIEKAVDMLQLKGTWKGKEWRGPCPACNSQGKRTLQLSAERGIFTCFATKPWTRGSIIKLVCHVRGLDPKGQALEAAEAISKHFGIPIGPATVPQRPEPGTNPAAPSANGKPGIESVPDRLIYEHPAVQALGLSPEDARRYRIGWRQSGGSLAGRLNFPICPPNVTPLTYGGYDPEKDPPFKFGKITLP